MNVVNFFGRSGVALCGVIALNAQAQTRYPERAIRIVIPFAPGGNTDLLGRRYAAKLTPLIGQNVVVDNKGGAGGNIGAAEVARAKPDGYTLLIGTSSTHALNPLMMGGVEAPYDPIRDLCVVWPGGHAAHGDRSVTLRDAEGDE